MNNEITIDHEGKKYSAEYLINGDTLIVILPDGSQRQTELRGLSPEMAARTHLASYAKKKGSSGSGLPS